MFRFLLNTFINTLAGLLAPGPQVFSLPVSGGNLDPVRVKLSVPNNAGAILELAKLSIGLSINRSNLHLTNMINLKQVCKSLKNKTTGRCTGCGLKKAFMSTHGPV